MIDPLVPASIAGIREGFLAVVALVQPLPGVGADVAGQVAAAGALPGTEAASEGGARAAAATVLRHLHHHHLTQVQTAVIIT